MISKNMEIAIRKDKNVEIKNKRKGGGNEDEMD